MHSDQESIKKTIRTYWMIGAALFVFTGITVAVNQVHLAVPLAITVALIIATMKGSMVASVFMHLSHERKWIYGALILTVIGFIILMTVPMFTMMDTSARRFTSAGAGGGAHGALMSLRMFHMVFIGVSVVLAAFVAAWAVQQYQTVHAVGYAITAARRASGPARHR